MANKAKLHLKNSEEKDSCILDVAGWPRIAASCLRLSLLPSPEDARVTAQQPVPRARNSKDSKMETMSSMTQPGKPQGTRNTAFLLVEQIQCGKGQRRA